MGTTMSVAAIDDITITQHLWAHLPNAEHINTVLKDVQRRPEAWEMGQRVAASIAYDITWLAAQRVTAADVWDTLDCTEWVAIVNELRSIVHPRNNADRKAALLMAESAVIALVAWDDSADLLECPPDVLRTMIDLAEPPVCHQAALLLPYALVRFGEESV